MKEMVICGCFRSEDGVLEDVYCDPSTGDLVRASDLIGNCLIGNVAVIDPVDMDGVNMVNILDYCKADGMVMTDTYLLTFHMPEMMVDYRKKTSPREIEKIVPFDLDVEYEGVIE